MLTKKLFRDIYLVCSNFDESKKAWELISNAGYDIGFTPQDYPNRFIYALNDSGRVYSTPLETENEYINTYWKKKRRLCYKDLFAPKSPLSEELTIQIVENFKKLGAINEDTGLNSVELEKETIDVGHCYDLVELKVLGNYNGRFFLKDKEKKEIIKPEIKGPQKPEKPIKVETAQYDDSWLCIYDENLN